MADIDNNENGGRFTGTDQRLSPSGVLEQGGGHVENTDNDDGIAVLDEAANVKQARDRLKDMCAVLGINYTSKLSEFGSVLETERVDKYVDFLTETRNSNFKELKEISSHLIGAWKSYNTPINRIENFSWIFSIHDAESATEVKERNILSTGYVKRAKNEVNKLIIEREKKLSAKLVTLKKKLEKLLMETHLTASDFQFDMSKEVNMKHYRSEKMLLKSAIKDVKAAAGVRKELVLRMEMLEKASLKKDPSLDDIKVMSQHVEEVLFRLEILDHNEYISYDGKDVEEVLKAYEAKAVASVSEREQRNKIPTRTRSGRPHTQN